MSISSHNHRKKRREESESEQQDQAPTTLVFRNKGAGLMREEQMVISATDTKGHTEAVWVRIQPGYLREVKMLLAEHKFPWKSIGDVMRFGLDQTVRWAVQQAKIKNSILPQIDMINNLVRDQTMQQQLSQTFEAVEEMLKMKGPRAKKIANDIWREINRMPDGYWKDRYKEEFEEKYGTLVGGVRLSDTVNGSGDGDSDA